MNGDRISEFVIVGGGTAGWMAAAALARFIGPLAKIRLIESDAIGTVGVGEATIPQIHLFNQGLGIDEGDFIRATNGSFKLGIEFVDWGAPGERFIHAFGTIGRSLGLIPFQHYWLRHRAEGGTSSLWDYSPAALAARANRFAPPVEQSGKLPSGVNYAYHFDASLYAAYLRRYAEARGVKRIEGRVVDVALDESGAIASIALEGDRRVGGQFFIDCSGFRGLLIEEALGAGYDDWSRWLPCDRAMAVPCESVSPLTPYTRSTAKDAGWQWRIPLQHRTGNGLVYSSTHLSDDRAHEILMSGLDGAPLAEPRPLKFTSGKRRRAWAKNCVALGLAAGFMEPLESTSIHLVQSGIARLLQLLPGQGVAEADIAEFNRQTDFEWTAIRDFIAFHYYANRRSGDFWAACRNMMLPEGLARKLDLFRANARIVRDQDELFTETGWMQVMIGQGILPAHWHPLADALSREQLDEFLALTRAHASHVANVMPDHAAYIAANCAAPGARAAA